MIKAVAKFRRMFPPGVAVNFSIIAVVQSRCTSSDPRFWRNYGLYKMEIICRSCGRMLPAPG
jgi:hypothetical protein